MRIGWSAVVVVALLAGCGGSDGDGDSGGTTAGPRETTTTSAARGPQTTTPVAGDGPLALELDIATTTAIHPVVAGGLVVTRVLGEVVVIDPVTGEGTALTTVGSGSELVAAGDAIVVDDAGGQVVVIDPANGTELARVEHPEGRRGVDVQTLWSDGERIAVGYDRGIAVFDLAGVELYRVGTGDAEVREVVVDGDFLSVETVGEVTEVALLEMPATKVSGAKDDASFIALLSGGRTLVREQPDGRLTLGNVAENTRAWRHQEGDRWLPHPLVIGETAWIVTEDGFLFLLDLATGFAQPVDTPGPTTRPPVVSDAGLVIVTDDGIVVVLDPDTGQPVTDPFELPDMDEVNGFAVDGSTVYVTAQQNAPDAQRDARVVLWGIDLDAL